jgi:hypothetical protein
MITPDGTPEPVDEEILLKVLTAHFKALVSARSDETLLNQYSALLRFLRSQPRGFLSGHARAKRAETPQLSLNLSEEDLLRLSLADLERLVNDEATPRRLLESIAVQRFSVPRGSMRSFSNRQMLIDKLRSVISNEHTHEAIGQVARGQTKKP